MTSRTQHQDWDSRAESVITNPIPAYDAMRQRCPVAHSEYQHWSVFRHADVLRVLGDHRTFSNAVSRYPSVPNGMDPPEHTRFRRVIDPYFSAQRMQDFAPECREIAVAQLRALSKDDGVVEMTTFAQDFVLRIECAFLGWPADLHEPLRQWIRRNHQATLSREQAAMDAVALEFDGYIKALLMVRRDAGDAALDDITTSLLRTKIGGKALAENDIVSILRNWTVGELGTMAASVEILAHYLATKPALQQQLREEPDLLPAAIDEILRIHPPLFSNRRIATEPTQVGGQALMAGDRITLVWASANRDEAVFGDPDECRLDRDPSQNLLYGAGIHVCPGAPLARLELCILMEELLRHTQRLELVAGQEPRTAVYPASGFASLPLHIHWQADAF
ncbi:MAG: cytochrome P450 [Rhodoferax sp.]